MGTEVLVKNMNIKQFRLGNFLDFTECVYLYQEDRNCHTLDFMDFKALYYFDSKNRGNWANPCYLDFIKPIPLTEEWLLKFGFKYDNDLKNIIYKSEIGCNTKNMEFTYMGFKLKKPKYVHQIQNLYFALTGKELEIK